MVVVGGIVMSPTVSGSFLALKTYTKIQHSFFNIVLIQDVSMLWLMLEVRHSVMHMWQNMVIAAMWLTVKILANRTKAFQAH
jgi:hypothetical protein